MDGQTTAPLGQRRLLHITALALTVALAAVILGITATRTPGDVDAQSDDLVITAITATSTQPGEIVVDLEGAPDADEYRIAWAKQDEDYKTYTDESANAFPTKEPYTITGLEEGTIYKVKARARSEDAYVPGPWSDEVTATVASTPASTPEPTPTSTPEPTDNDGPPVLPPRCFDNEHSLAKDSYSSEDDDFTDGPTAANVDFVPITDWITGGTTTGNIEVGCDEDWIAIGHEGNNLAGFLIRIEGIGESPLAQPRLWGYYAYGSRQNHFPVMKNLSSDSNVFLHVLDVYGGHTPHIGINSASTSATGAYQVTIRMIYKEEQDDVPYTTETEAFFTAHGLNHISYRERGVSGELLGESDRDWIRVHLEEGEVYGFSVTTGGYPAVFPGGPSNARSEASTTPTATSSNRGTGPPCVIRLARPATITSKSTRARPTT